MNEILEQLEKLIGVKLTPCDYFTGVSTCNGKEYFNIMMDERISESLTYEKLMRIIPLGVISDVQPNGLYRLAIFF